MKTKCFCWICDFCGESLDPSSSKWSQENGSWYHCHSETQQGRVHATKTIVVPVKKEEFCQWTDCSTYIADPHYNQIKWQGAGVFQLEKRPFCGKTIKIVKSSGERDCI